MEQRIKGQEVEVLISVGNEPKLAITDVRNFEFNIQLEILKEGYLGERTQRRDEIYNGIAGKMDLHLSSSEALTLVKQIVGRAKRQLDSLGVRVNIKATLNFPDGTTPRVIFPNVFFGEVPITASERNAYVALSLPFECEDFDILTT